MALISQNFKNDTNTNSYNVEPVVVVADLVDDKYEVLDIYSTSSYRFKDQDQFDLKQSKDILNKVSSIKSSVDYESKKIRSNTFRFSINNYFDVNKKLTSSSDYSLEGGTSLNSLIGKYIILFYKTPSTESLFLLKETDKFITYDSLVNVGLCSAMFYGVINRVSQKQEIITIQAEDFTEDYIKDKQVPSKNVSSLPSEAKTNLINKDLERPIPMVYGFVDHVPTISYKTNIPNTEGFVSLAFACDSHPITNFTGNLSKSSLSSPYSLYLKDGDDYVTIPYQTVANENSAELYFIQVTDNTGSAYIVPDLHEEDAVKESLYGVGILPVSTFVGVAGESMGSLSETLTGIVQDFSFLSNSEAITGNYNKKNIWSGDALDDGDFFVQGPVTFDSSDEHHSQWFLLGLDKKIVINKIRGVWQLFTAWNSESNTPDTATEITNSDDFSLYGKPFDPSQFREVFDNESEPNHVDKILNDATVGGEDFPNYGHSETKLTAGNNYINQEYINVGASTGALHFLFTHNQLKSKYNSSDSVDKFLLFDYKNVSNDITIGYAFKDLMFEYIKKYDNYVDEDFYCTVNGRKDYFSTEPISSLNDLNVDFNISIQQAVLGSDGVSPNFNAVVDEWDSYFINMWTVFPSEEQVLTQDTIESWGMYSGAVGVQTFLWKSLFDNTGGDTYVPEMDFAVNENSNGVLYNYNIKNFCDSDDSTIFSSSQIIENVLHGSMKKFYMNCFQAEIYTSEFEDFFRTNYSGYIPDYAFDIDSGHTFVERFLFSAYVGKLRNPDNPNTDGLLEIPEIVESMLSGYGEKRRLLLRRIFKYLYQSDLNEESSIDNLVSGFAYEWDSFDIDITTEEGIDTYVENLRLYLDDTISTINKSIFNRGSRLQGTMSLDEWNEQFPDLDDTLRFGKRNEFYVWNDSPDYITHEFPELVNLYNYIHLDSIKDQMFSVFSQDNTYETSGEVKNPVDICMNVLLRELDYGISNNLVDSSFFDSKSIQKARDVYSGYHMGFCVNEKQEASSLLQDIANESKSIFTFTSEGKFSVVTIKNDYVYDDIDFKIIEEDVFNFNITRSKREKIITSSRCYYKYDNGHNRYKRLTPLLKAEDIYSGYNGYEYYNINPETTYEEKELRYHSHEPSVLNYQRYDLGQNINQHLLINIELPLSYSEIGVGSVLHIPLLNNEKAFGIDYSILQTLNGQTLLPVWIVVGIDISLDKVKVEAMQLHHLKSSISDVTGFSIPEVEGSTITVNTKRENSIYTYPDGSPVLNWNYVNTDYVDESITVEDSGIEIPYGDIDVDESIDILDVVILVDDILAGGGTLSAAERERADVNFDGRVDIIDAVMLMDIILG